MRKSVSFVTAELDDRTTTTSKAILPSPFTSHPPEPIALHPDTIPRHACLQSIRQRQFNLLRDLVKDASEILLVDPAYHSNVGDHMITVGELQFLHKYTTTENKISQCSYAQAGDYVPPCTETIARNRAAGVSVAVWHGGGNWGDLWRRAQEPRIASFQDLLLQANFSKIVTMPNSWYYRNHETETSDIQRIQQNIMDGLNVSDEATLYATAKDRVVFTWREHYSYERAVQHFPFCTNLLVPDIAFQLGPYHQRASLSLQEKNSQTDLLVLLRNDHESIYSQYRNRQSFRSILQQAIPGRAEQITFSIVDWPDRLDRFDSDDIFFTETAIQLLSLGRVVICDRLHAAILAYLTGLYFVYLDQETGKITKTLTVAMESGGGIACPDDDETWSRAYNLTDAVRQAVDLMDRHELKPAAGRALRREQRRRRKQNQQQASP